MSDASRLSVLRRLHAITGVFPVGIWLVFHLWETGSALSGRRSFEAAVSGSAGGAVALALEITLVLVPLGFHAAAGVVLALQQRADRDPGPFASRTWRSFQWATGLVALAFVFLHLAHTWLTKLGGLDAAAQYDELMASLGRPTMLVAYVVGITCVCFHAAQGLGALPIHLGLVTETRALRASRLLGLLVGVALWLVALNTVSHFAIGRAVLWGGHASGLEPTSTATEEP